MKFKEILNEIKIVLEKVKEEDVDLLIDKILNSNTIVTIGAGRVGMAIKGFAMRLGHLGNRSYHIGDTTLPGIAKNDLVIVASGSGETQTIFDLTSIAKKNDATIFCITGNSESRIANLSDYTLIVEAPSKVKEVDGFRSIQPMTTLNEQVLGILFDSVILKIMEKTGENHDSMWQRHSNLE